MRRETGSREAPKYAKGADDATPRFRFFAALSPFLRNTRDPGLRGLSGLGISPLLKSECGSAW